jgi:adenylate/guanylate cyclase family protein
MPNPTAQRRQRNLDIIYETEHLAVQTAVKQYAGEVQRTRGVPIQSRVGLNSGEVVVCAIGSDLHIDYTAVGQTTHHLVARMEQMAKPGSVLTTGATLRLSAVLVCDVQASIRTGGRRLLSRLSNRAARKRPSGRHQVVTGVGVSGEASSRTWR